MSHLVLNLRGSVPCAWYGLDLSAEGPWRETNAWLAFKEALVPWFDL
jgi:hypothetical protein